MNIPTACTECNSQQLHVQVLSCELTHIVFALHSGSARKRAPRSAMLDEEGPEQPSGALPNPRPVPAAPSPRPDLRPSSAPTRRPTHPRHSIGLFASPARGLQPRATIPPLRRQLQIRAAHRARPPPLRSSSALQPAAQLQLETVARRLVASPLSSIRGAPYYNCSAAIGSPMLC